MFEKFYKHIMEPEKYGSICAAINCHRDKNVNPRGFFSFPSNEERCKQWVIRCRRLDLYAVPPNVLAKYYSLCKKHFDLTAFKGDISKITNSDELPYPTLFVFPFIRYSVPLQDPVSKTIKQRDFDQKIFPGGVNFKSINRVVIMRDDKLFLSGGPLLRPKNIICCPETKILLYSPKEMFLLETSYYCLALVGEIKMTDQDFGHLGAIGLFNICEAFVTYRTVAQMFNDNSTPPVDLEKIEAVHKEFIGDIKCKYMGKDSVKIAQEAGNTIRKHLENHKYRRRTIPTILNKNKAFTQDSSNKTYLNPSEASSAVHHGEEPTSNKSKPRDQNSNVGDKVVSTLKKIADPHQVNGVSQFAVLIDPDKKDCKGQVTLAPMEFFELPKLNLVQGDDESGRKLYQTDLSNTCSEDALPHSLGSPANINAKQLENTLSQSKNVVPQTISISHSKITGPESKEREHQHENVLCKSYDGDSHSEAKLPHSKSSVSQSKMHVTQANCEIKQLENTSLRSKYFVVRQTKIVTCSKDSSFTAGLHKNQEAKLTHTLPHSKSHGTQENCEIQQLENTSLSQSNNVADQTSSVTPKSKEREHKCKKVLNKSCDGDSHSEAKLTHTLPHSKSSVLHQKSHGTQSNYEIQRLENTSLSQSNNVADQTSSVTPESKERDDGCKKVLHKSCDGDSHSEAKLPHTLPDVYLHSKSTVSQTIEAPAQPKFSHIFNDFTNCFGKTDTFNRRRNCKSDTKALASESSSIITWTNRPITYTKTSRSKNQNVDTFKNKCFTENESSKQLNDTCNKDTEQICFTAQQIKRSHNQIPQTVDVADLGDSIDLTSIEDIHFRPTTEYVKHEPVIFKHPLYKTGNLIENQEESENDEGLNGEENDEPSHPHPVEVVKVPYVKSTRQEKFVLLSQGNKRSRSNSCSYDSDKEIISDDENNTCKRSRLLTLNGLYKDVISRVPITDKLKSTLKGVFSQNCNRDAAQLKAKRSLVKIPVGNKKTVPITKEYINNLLTQALILPTLQGNDSDKAGYETDSHQQDSMVVGNEIVIDQEFSHEQELPVENISNNQPVSSHEHPDNKSSDLPHHDKPSPNQKSPDKLTKKHHDKNSNDLSHNVKPSSNRKSPKKPTKKQNNKNSNDFTHISIHCDKTSSNHKSMLELPAILNQKLPMLLSESPKKFTKKLSESLNDFIKFNKPVPLHIKRIIKHVFPAKNVIVHKVSASDKKSSTDWSTDVFDKPLYDLVPREVIVSSDLSLKLSTVPVDHEDIPRQIKDIMCRSNKKVCRLIRINEFHPSKTKVDSVKTVTESIDYDTRLLNSNIKPQLKVEVNSDFSPNLPNFSQNEDIVKSITFDGEQQYTSFQEPEPVALEPGTDRNCVSDIETKAPASIVPINPSPLMRTYKKRHPSRANDNCGLISADDTNNIQGTSFKPYQDSVKGASSELKSFIENFSSTVSDPPISPDDFSSSCGGDINPSSSSNDLSASRIVQPKIISIGPNLKVVDFKSNYMPKSEGLSKFDMTLPPPAPVVRNNDIVLRPPTPKPKTNFSVKPHKCQCANVALPSDLTWYLTKSKIDKVPEPYKELANKFMELKVENSKLKKKYYRCKMDKEKIRKRHRPIKIKDLIVEVKKYLTPEAYEFLKSSITLKKYKSKGFRYSDELKRVCCKLVLSGGWKSYLYLASFFALPNRRTILRFIYHQIEVIRSAKQIQDAVDSIGLPSTSTGFQGTTIDPETSAAIQNLIPENSSAFKNLKLEEIIPPGESSVVQNVEDTELFHANDILSFGFLGNILNAEAGPSDMRGVIPPPLKRAKKKPRERSKSPNKRKKTKKSDAETVLSHDESGERVRRKSSQNKKRKKIKQSPSRLSMPDLNADGFDRTDAVAVDNASERNFQDVFNDWMNNLTMATHQDQVGPSCSSSARQNQTSVRSRKSSSPIKREHSSGGKTKRNYEHHNYYMNPVDVVYHSNSYRDREQCYEEVVHSPHYQDSQYETDEDSSVYNDEDS